MTIYYYDLLNLLMELKILKA